MRGLDCHPQTGDWRAFLRSSSPLSDLSLQQSSKEGYCGKERKSIPSCQPTSLPPGFFDSLQSGQPTALLCLLVFQRSSLLHLPGLEEGDGWSPLEGLALTLPSPAFSSFSFLILQTRSSLLRPPFSFLLSHHLQLRRPVPHQLRLHSRKPPSPGRPLRGLCTLPGHVSFSWKAGKKSQT